LEKNNIMAAQVVIFIVLAILILFGAHYFLYLSLINFFSIVNTHYKKILLAAFSFLTLSFVLSTLLIYWRENIFTRFFYFISGFWLGLLVNLLIALVVIWAFFWAKKIFNSDSNLLFIGVIFFSLAFIYSVYGVWNGFNPQAKNITVNIPNLPESWKNKKIVQISDLHIGHIHKKKFLDGIIEKVNSAQPEIVVITGDLFDGMDGNLDYIADSTNKIRAEKGVFFITGNHETYFGLDKVYEILKKTKINPLYDRVADVGGLKIIGISYPERGANKNLAETIGRLKKDFYGQPNILLYHSPSNIDLIRESGVNLQLSGHTHKGQVFPFGYITKMIFKGYDYGLYKIGEYTLYSSCGAGTWGPPMRTGNKPEVMVITLE